MATPVFPNAIPTSATEPAPSVHRSHYCSRILTAAALAAMVLVFPGCGEASKEVVVRDASADPQQRERDQEMVQRLRQQQGYASPQQGASAPAQPTPPVSQ